MDRHYFFKIKFVLFLYLLLAASWKENNLSWYISVIRDSGVPSTSIYSAVFLASLYYNYVLVIYRIYDYDMLTLSQ